MSADPGDELHIVQVHVKCVEGIIVDLPLADSGPRAEDPSPSLLRAKVAVEEGKVTYGITAPSFKLEHSPLKTPGGDLDADTYAALWAGQNSVSFPIMLRRRDATSPASAFSLKKSLKLTVCLTDVSGNKFVVPIGVANVSISAEHVARGQYSKKISLRDYTDSSITSPFLKEDVEGSGPNVRSYCSLLPEAKLMIEMFLENTTMQEPAPKVGRAPEDVFRNLSKRTTKKGKVKCANQFVISVSDSSGSSVSQFSPPVMAPKLPRWRRLTKRVGRGFRCLIPIPHKNLSMSRSGSLFELKDEDRLRFSSAESDCSRTFPRGIRRDCRDSLRSPVPPISFSDSTSSVEVFKRYLGRVSSPPRVKWHNSIARNSRSDPGMMRSSVFPEESEEQVLNSSMMKLLTLDTPYGAMDGAVEAVEKAVDDVIHNVTSLGSKEPSSFGVPWLSQDDTSATCSSSTSISGSQQSSNVSSVESSLVDGRIEVISPPSYQSRFGCGATNPRLNRKMNSTTSSEPSLFKQLLPMNRLLCNYGHVRGTLSEEDMHEDSMFDYDSDDSAILSTGAPVPHMLCGNHTSSLSQQSGEGRIGCVVPFRSVPSENSLLQPRLIVHNVDEC